MKIEYYIISTTRQGTDSGEWVYNIDLRVISPTGSAYNEKNKDWHLGTQNIAILKEDMWKSLGPSKDNTLIEGEIEMPLVGATPEIIWSKIIADCKANLSADALSVIKLDNVTMPADTHLAEFIKSEKMQADKGDTKEVQAAGDQKKSPAKKT